MWNPLASHQCLALRDVRVNVRVGVHAVEHAAPQVVSVDVEMYRQVERFTGTTLADCLDYDRIHRHLTEAWPKRPHIDLLEKMADELVEFCMEDGRVEACRVVIRKPDVYPGSPVPEIALFRVRSG